MRILIRYQIVEQKGEKKKKKYCINCLELTFPHLYLIWPFLFFSYFLSQSKYDHPRDEDIFINIFYVAKQPYYYFLQFFLPMEVILRRNWVAISQTNFGIGLKVFKIFGQLQPDVNSVIVFVVRVVDSCERLWVRGVCS